VVRDAAGDTANLIARYRIEGTGFDQEAERAFAISIAANENSSLVALSTVPLNLYCDELQLPLDSFQSSGNEEILAHLRERNARPVKSAASGTRR
jgi:hypothetical protein